LILLSNSNLIIFIWRSFIFFLVFFGIVYVIIVVLIHIFFIVACTFYLCVLCIFSIIGVRIIFMLLLFSDRNCIRLVICCIFIGNFMGLAS